MKPIQPYRRRVSPSFWLGMLLLPLMAVGGIVGLLLVLGVNLNPFAAIKEDPFVVRIPINSRAIPAYERVAREHLLNPATGGLMYQRVPPSATVGMSITGVTTDGSHLESRIEQVRNVDDQVVFVVTDGREVPQSQTLELGGALMSVNAIIGRVVKKDKRPGMGFREETFFPEGTPEGISGATPPGMRAVTLDATKLTGVHALNAGDRIDLMASIPVGELSSFSSQSTSRLPAAALVASAGNNNAPVASEPVLLAQNAVVLKPVYIRNEATTSSSLTQGKRVQNVPKYEVAIAVAPDDVLPLQTALSRALAITCITHSMQSGASDATSPAVAEAQTAVPVTVRPVLAFDVVTRDVFVSPATRRLRMEPVSQQEIDRLGIITSVSEAMGAVARHDIPAGSFLRRSDLLTGSPKPATDAASGVDLNARTDSSREQVFRRASQRGQATSFQPPGESGAAPSMVGDRPAITQFVPPGHTAIAIPWNRLYGAEHLQIGDEIDLLASFSLASENAEEETETRPDGTRIIRKRQNSASRATMRSWDETFGLRGEPWFVASDALVIGPVGFPPPASAQRALGELLTRSSTGASREGFDGPPLLIAVDDRDVDSVAAAFATQQALFTPVFHPSRDNQIVPAGMMRIAIAAQDVQAFEQFSETVWQGNRRRALTRVVDANDPRFADAMTVDQVQACEYRVLRRLKRRGEFFVASDFLPVGTGPGVAAAAGPGSSIFAVADREIEGLDAFETDDSVAILVRGVVKPPSGVVRHGLPLDRPVAHVIVPSVRIVRASLGGQTILEVANEDLTRLQAAWAESFSTDTAHHGQGARSQLLAVALARSPSQQDANRLAEPAEAERDRQFVDVARQTEPTAATIPPFDPVGEWRLMEAMVGSQRQVHAFPGLPAGPGVSGDSPAARPYPASPSPASPNPASSSPPTRQ